MKKAEKPFKSAMLIVGLIGLGLIALGSIATLSASPRRENKIEETVLDRVDTQLSISDSISISLDVFHSDVYIELSPDDEVHISYHNTDQRTYEIKQNNDKLTLNQVNHQNSSNINWKIIDVRVFIPAQFSGSLTIESESSDVNIDAVSANSIDVNTDYGNIGVEQISSQKDIKLDTSHGNIDLRDVNLTNANRFDIKTSYGDILAVRTSLQGDIRFDSSHGNIDLRDVILANARTFDVHTNYGDIKAVRTFLQGNIRFDTSHGKIDLYDVNLINASTFDAHTSYGDMIAEKISSEGNIRFETSHGEIDLYDVNLTNASTLYVNTSYNDIDLYAVVAKTIEISAGYGKIDAEQITCTDISMEGTSGDIKFTDLDAQNITIDITEPSGSRNDSARRGSDIRGNIIGKQSDFSVTSRTDSGSNNLSDQTGSGSKTLNVFTYLGDIDISFTE